MAGDGSDEQDDAIVANDFAGRPYGRPIDYKHQSISDLLKGLGEARQSGRQIERLQTDESR